MIYTEGIHADNSFVFLERQKNTIHGNWYFISLCLEKTDGTRTETLSDNDTWIISELFPLLNSDPNRALAELGLLRSRGHNPKDILKIIKKARKLGWFDEIFAKKVVED